MSKKLKLFLFFTVAVIFLCFMASVILQKKKIIIQGEVDANRVDISSRVQGRVIDYYAKLGDKVKKGDILVRLDSPPLYSQKETAIAQLAVAKASRDNIYSVRPENISQEKAALDTAEANLVLARKDFERIKALVDKGSVSKQTYDQYNDAYQSAIQVQKAAKATLDLTISGNSKEAKKLADAQVVAAEKSLEEINTDIKELTVPSPISSVVTTRIAEKGQLYNPNTPLYTMIDLDDVWFVFNVREDYLSNLNIGDTFTVTVPALNNKKIEARITVLNVLGEYANWKATKATGDFDLKTFEVRAKPITPITGLHPGMSAIATW
ncbi:HlyD family secretion protein [Serratia sp. S1B]|nr:HlyD family secretion protein [Serratia sp. S1B]